MKKIMFLMALSFAWGSAFASCDPYSIPTANSTIACPDGYAGVQYKLTTKSCPSGEIVNSPYYITSGCVAIVHTPEGDTVNGKPYTRPDSTCTPYTIPTPGTSMPCSGRVGLQYKTTTKVCPSGVITNSSDYNTSGCSLPPATHSCANVGITTNQDGSCATSGVAPGCPAGKHWAVTGTPNIARCVPDVVVNCDMGVTNGSAVTCTVAGLPGYTGTAYRERYTTYSGGGACTIINTGTFNTSGCTPPPTPNCNTGITDSASLSCPAAGLAGYTGTAYYRVYTTYSVGGACNTVAAPGFDTTGCTPSCTPSVVNGSNVVCDAGFTGFKHGVTTTSCPGNVVTFAWDTSACAPIIIVPSVCQNGASNYPTCTFPCSTVMSSFGAGPIWGSTVCYSNTGADQFLAGSNMALKCHNPIIQEVNRVNQTTGTTDIGYMCAAGGAILYDYNGAVIPLH